MSCRSLLATGLGAFVLSACSTAVGSTQLSTAPTRYGQTPQATIPAGVDPFAPVDVQTRVDEQGAIVVEITPSIMDAAAEQIVFDVALNTHSIDLSMDLAPRATLRTDTGLSVPGASWDAPPGGHHVSGRLVFPSLINDVKVLEGTKHVTLTITDLDAPSRTFEWDVP